MSLGLSPFRLREADWQPVVARLIALRRNVLAFYTQPEEVVELFRDQSVALVFANYGNQQVEALRAAGADIAYVIPREGALTWVDCWAIMSSSLQRRLAEAWIDFTLQPEISRHLTVRHGLANTLDGGDALQAGKAAIWLEPVEDPERREALWLRIYSGDRPERF